MKVPRNKSFLCFVSYSSTFIPKFSSLTSNLRKLLVNNSVWKWTSEHQADFEVIKTKLTESTMLAYFNYDRSTEVSVDFSKEGISASLYQCDGKGSKVPISFRSRATTKAERNYSPIEGEALAVSYACDVFQIYLLGMENPFKIITDHAPLVDVFSCKNTKISLRLEKLRDRVQAFNFVMTYRKGENNPDDFNSRHPCIENMEVKSASIAVIR